jgi:hypothetical protein
MYRIPRNSVWFNRSLYTAPSFRRQWSTRAAGYAAILLTVSAVTCSAAGRAASGEPEVRVRQGEAAVAAYGLAHSDAPQVDPKLGGVAAVCGDGGPRFGPCRRAGADALHGRGEGGGADDDDAEGLRVVPEACGRARWRRSTH